MGAAPRSKLCRTVPGTPSLAASWQTKSSRGQRGALGIVLVPEAPARTPQGLPFSSTLCCFPCGISSPGPAGLADPGGVRLVQAPRASAAAGAVMGAKRCCVVQMQRSFLPAAADKGPGCPCLPASPCIRLFMTRRWGGGRKGGRKGGARPLY